MGMPGKERMRSMVEEWPCGARMVSCEEQPAGGAGAGRRNLTLVLAHVALVWRLVEVLAVLQGGTHACSLDV